MNIFLTSPISFPGLGIEGINPPDGFSIPGTNFEIKFYGVIIAIGVLLAVTYCLRRAKQFGVTQDDILNLVLICLPSAIVGARLYYVIFEWDQFFGPGIPWYRFLDIRSGGLAIYGGVIGAVLGMLIYTRVRKLKIFPCLDLTGIGLGGNKVRKLEFLLADAKRKGAEVVFTTGGAQSNHAMLTAACAKKLGMEPILILTKRGVTERKGNQLLEYLMDTDVRFMDTDSYDDIYAEMDRVSKASGKKYYKIPCGGSNAGVELVSVLHRGESEASDHA